MTWNYRIIDHGTHLALHEVFYDEAGAPFSWTAEPVRFVCDPEEGSKGIILSLEMALDDARQRPVLDVNTLPNN